MMRRKEILTFEKCGPLMAYHHRGDLRHWRCGTLHLIETVHGPTVHEDRYNPYEHLWRHVFVDFAPFFIKLISGILTRFPKRCTLKSPTANAVPESTNERRQDMLDVLTKILVAAAIPLITALIALVGNWLRAKSQSIKQGMLHDTVDSVVDAVEQMTKDTNDTSSEKFHRAQAMLTDVAKRIGIKLSTAEANALIEASVRELNNTIDTWRYPNLPKLAPSDDYTPQVGP